MEKQEVFFLRGFMRSGTNWTGRILNLHPDIRCAGEFHLESFGGAKRKIDKSVSCYVLEDRQEELDKQFETFIKTMVRQFCGKEYKFVGDRTPVAINTVVVPNAKYLVISRDGRDVITSWFKHVLNIALKRKNNLARYNHFNSIPEMVELVKQMELDPNYVNKNKRKLLASEEFFRMTAKKWNDRVVNDKKAAEMMKNSGKGIEVYWIDYEQMHGNIEEERAKIYSFLGADPLRATPLNDVNMPGYNNKRGGRGKVGKWIEYFTPKQARWFDQEASEALKILGYEPTQQLFEEHRNTKQVNLK